jgi:hypothetical protein
VKLLRASIVALAMVSASTAAAQSNDPIDQTAKDAYVEGKYAFCTAPTKPLGGRQRGLCELAAEIEGCKGFLDACQLRPEPKNRSWLEGLAEWLGPIARALLYVLVGGIVLVVAIPVIRALMKRWRNTKLTTPAHDEPNRALLVEPPPVVLEEISDAEAALRLAEEHRARGELKRALALYLAASLSALNRRGAIRIARHRTNGEYVRGCTDDVARPPLREIVREVDKAEFGGTEPTEEALGRVSTSARAIVRVTTMTLLALALASGCTPPARGSDPAGDELPTNILERNGFKVGGLDHSLATMPIPEGEGSELLPLPIVVVDVEKVPLEDDARAHMMRWVEAGGVLVLFGDVRDWPEEARPVDTGADTRDLVVRMSNDDEDETEIRGARVARRSGFEWKAASEPVAFLGEKTYAARRRFGKGVVLGIANDDLFTNVGMMPPHNAAALVTLLRSTAGEERHDVRVARAEDGIPPPSNPFAALMAAGLGKFSWHALAAAIVLFLAYGIRHARPRPSDRKERRAFAEHIEATAAVYGRTRAHGHALAAYGRFVDGRLRETIPRGSDPIQFLAQRSGVEAAEVAKLYERAMTVKADEAPRGDELTVIEELRRLMEKALTRPV